LKKSGSKKVKAALADEEDDDDMGDKKDKKKKEPKWDVSKLAVGNWFSGTRYYKAVE
jgi:hypothetical protein